MVVLGVEPVGADRVQRRNLGSDLTETRSSQNALKPVSAVKRRSKLIFVESINTRSVLGANIVSLLHALRWVVRLPEGSEELFVADLGGVKDHEYSLGMARSAGADLLVGGVCGKATDIADCCGDDPWYLPKNSLNTPEAALSKDRYLRPVREGRVD